MWDRGAIRHPPKHHSAAANMNPTSLISLSARKLKAYRSSLSLSVTTPLFFLFGTEATEKTHPCAVFVLFHPWMHIYYEIKS